jgi:hypothetical protein
VAAAGAAAAGAAEVAGVNTGRVIAGGLVAGIVANIGDFISNAYLLADQMDFMRQRLNIDVQTWESTGSLITWTVVDFVLGFLMVFTYAAMRPRLGPGPLTAVIAAFVPFASATAVIVGFSHMGIFSPDVVLKASLLSLVTMSLASLAGARIYQE